MKQWTTNNVIPTCDTRKAIWPAGYYNSEVQPPRMLTDHSFTQTESTWQLINAKILSTLCIRNLKDIMGLQEIIPSTIRVVIRAGTISIELP